MYFLFPFDQIDKNSIIVLYGTGKMGSDFYYQIMSTSYCHIEGWTDSDILGGDRRNPPFCNKSQLSELKYDYLVIAINNAYTIQKDVVPLLLDIGVPPEKIIWRFDQSLDESKKERYFEKWKLTDKTYEKNLYEICGRRDCTGCGACSVVCPNNAIRLIKDDCGFLYPDISDKCTRCGRCREVCPSRKQIEFNENIEILSAVSNDKNVVFNSSSGGVGTELVSYYLKHGGVVFGAVTDENLDLKQVVIETIHESNTLSKSKYVQSDMTDTYTLLAKYIRKDRPVLFIGTPCMIAGIKSVYGEVDLQHVLFVDLFCHGVMSSELLKCFLKEYFELEAIGKIVWRDKTYGWQKSVNSMRVELTDGSNKIITGEDNYLMKAYLDNLALRDSCYWCRYQRVERIGDISLGDAWWVDSGEDGLSVVSINTNKGKIAFSRISENIRSCRKAKYLLGANAVRKFQFSSQTNRFKDLFRKELSFGEIYEKTKNEKYDIAIVGGYHWSNYGDEITYYALYRVLKNWGYDILMVNWPRSANWWTKKRPLLFAENPYGDYELNDVSDSYSQLKNINDKVNTFVIGSGLYVHPGISAETGYLQLLEWVSDEHKKIAYSMAFGTAELDIPEDLIRRYKQALNRFDAIGIRDKSGVNLLSRVFGIKDAKWVLDPVFLMDVEEYLRLMRNYKKDSEPYLYTYVLDNMHGLETNQYIELIINELNVPNRLISRYEKADDFLDRNDLIYKAPLEEWLSSFYFAKYVLTDSFHGVCLCIKFHKEFSVFIGDKKWGSTRITGLLEHFGLMERIVNSKECIKKNLNKLIDYESVDKILDLDIHSSLSWLKETIDGKGKSYESNWGDTCKI